MTNEQLAIMLSAYSGYCKFHDIDCDYEYDDFYKRWYFRCSYEKYRGVQDFVISNKGVVDQGNYMDMTAEQIFAHRNRDTVSRYLRDNVDKIIDILLPLSKHEDVKG